MQTVAILIIVLIIPAIALVLVVRQIRSRPQDDFLQDRNDWGAQ
ncbi:hypothetical protein [Aliihoeflea sp. PC F10.4]